MLHPSQPIEGKMSPIRSAAGFRHFFTGRRHAVISVSTAAVLG